MEERDLQVFIDVTTHYFAKATQQPAVIGEPFIQMEQPVLLDYSGFVRISGRSEGYIYLTTPKDMLAALLRAEGEKEFTREDLADLVGEMANTIISNVRRVYGNQFRVSVPVVVPGRDLNGIRLPFLTFVVPIEWKEYESYLVLGLEK